mgnify:CR=1 FL=1
MNLSAEECSNPCTWDEGFNICSAKLEFEPICCNADSHHPSTFIFNSDDEKTYYLIKQFKFNNFLESQNFVNKIGNLAEKEGHHPDIWFGWGYAKIKIFTHAIKGLHESDFILAAKVDQIP